ncbi:MAG: branched-chain amino acid ABC transporter permease [Acidimicrobiales bacterium]|jgi:branched-chain amino acid transport system permease protein
MTILWSALSVGAIYSLLAITLNLIYTSVGVFNFAQGAILTLGVYISYTGVADWHLPTALAALVGGVVCAVAGLVEARICLLPRALGRNELLTTVGVATLLAGAISLIWGENDRLVASPVSSRILTVFGGRVAPDQLLLIALAIVFAAGIALWYRFTLAGLASLAVAEDRDAARVRGINVLRKSIVAFVIGGAIAGFIGLAVGSQTYAYPELASSLVLYAFVAFVLGGAGSLGGSLLGGLILGCVQQYSARYVSVNYSDVIVFGLLLTTLMVFPNGLFARTKVRTV